MIKYLTQRFRRSQRKCKYILNETDLLLFSFFTFTSSRKVKTLLLLYYHFQHSLVSVYDIQTTVFYDLLDVEIQSNFFRSLFQIYHFVPSYTITAQQRYYKLKDK